MISTRKSSCALLNPARFLLNETSRRTHFKKPFFYGNKYLGGFEYHDQEKYPRRFSFTKEEELLEEIRSIKSNQIDQPSPFHIVRRVRPMNVSWNQRVTLRRLNLHSSKNGDCVIVPNTPQYNDMLMRVKHLIQLKPAIFEDGRIPEEGDIGALKICPYTGRVKIDERMRLLAKRVNPGKPILFQGNHLRSKINSIYGLSRTHHIA